MSFNPNLESNIGFSQAVEQPNAMGAIAGLFNNLGVFDKPQAAAKPTEDEQFAAAWDSFSSAQGVALDPNNPNYNSNIKTMAPAFLRQFPQFGSQVSSMMSASGIQLPMDTETYRQDAEAKAAIDMQTEFKFSPRGMLADANARSYATDENGNFNQNKYNEYYNKEQAKHYSTQAEITALTEQASIAENRTKVGASYWSAGKDFANTFMLTQLSGLSNLMTDIQDGTAEVTPEMAAVLGIKPGQINAQNFYIALQAYRPNLARMLKDATAGELASAGADIDILSTTNPDKAWYDEVMAPVDSLIKIAETNFGDVSKTLKTLQDGDTLITLQTIKATDPDLYGRINVANAIPPELRTQVFDLFNEKGEAWNNVANALSLQFGATGETPESNAARISDMAKPDAEAALEFSLGVVETGRAEGDNLRNATMTVFSAMDRVKPNEFFGYDTFKSLTKNAAGIVAEAAADPVFGNFVSQKVLADLNKNFKALTLQTQGNPNLSIVMNDGQLQVVSSGGQMVTGMTGTAVDQSTVEFNAMEVQRIMESPEFIGLQNKLNDMKAFGDMGKTISEAFGMENGLIQQGQDEVKGSAGSDTLSSPIMSVVDAGKGFTTVRRADGTVERVEGTRAWRNNNPGNIEYGDFAKGSGAVGSDGRFAVFPTYEQGRAAKKKLLWETRGYSGKTISEAINRYAPPVENDTNSYINSVASAVGISSDTPMSSLTESQKEAMLDAMEIVEGFRPGKITAASASSETSEPRPTNINDLVSRPAATPSPNYIDKASVDLSGGSQVAVQSVSGAVDTPLADQAIEAQGGSQAVSETSQPRMQSLDPQVQALITALVQDGRLSKGEKIKIGDKEIEVA